MRLIDADELRKDMQFVLDTLGEPTRYGLRQAMSIIDKTPTEDAKPIRHGKWLTKEYMYGLEDHEDEWVERLAEYGDCAYCSMCGGYAGLDSEEEYALTLYCPNCGAKMENIRKYGEE